MKMMRRKNRRKLTNEGLMVVLSVLLLPSFVLICADCLVAVACAGLWCAAAVVIAKLWSPGWANRVGERYKKWLDD